MCAINPRFKKRYILDCYTSHPTITEEQFKDLIVGLLVAVELDLNSSGKLRFHIKETEQEAD